MPDRPCPTRLAIGVALGASYVDEPYHIEEFNAWGYPSDPGAAVIGGSKSYVTSTDLKRLGLQGTLEFAASPTFTMTLDAFYSDFKDDQIKRGIELPLFWSGAQLQPGFTVTDGLVSSGTFAGVKGVVRNDAFERHAKLFSVGWNGRHEGENGFNVMGDVSYSRTDRNELILESYAGTGRGGVGATDTIAFTSGPGGTMFDPGLNYGDYNSILLTSPQGWGGDQTAVDGTRIRGGQDGYYNNRIIDDELWQFRLDVEQEFETGFLSGIQAGASYINRTKSLTPDEAFLGLTANTDGLTSVTVPEEYRRGTTNLGFLGLGPMISYDPRELLAAGIYQLVANPYGDVVLKAYDVAEVQKIAYVQANIRSSFGASELTGNVGVQAIHTDQSSRGASAVFLGTNPNGSPNIGGIPREDGAEYWDVLPSANLSLRMPGDFVIRVGAAREIVRGRLDDLKASLSYGLDFSVVANSGVVRGNSGNPQLRPWRANAIDVTFEKYWGTQAYVAAQLFWKDLRSYIYKTRVPFDFTGYPVPQPTSDPDGGGPLPPVAIPVIFQGDLEVPINGEGGTMKGIEVAGTLPFSTFSAALDGFGITGGVSYTDTSIAPTPGAPPEDIPGYSKWVVNGTAFFERAGFSARSSVRYRSTFVGELSGFGGSPTRRRAIGETIVDAQIGYEFQPGSALQGLSVFLQGQNLTDEPFVTHNPGQRDEVIDYQRYGRRFLAGFNFKF